MFKFSAKTQVIETADSAGTVADICREEKAGRVGLVLDHFLHTHPLVVAIHSALEAQGVVVVFRTIKAVEPTTDMVDALTGDLRGERLDLLVGIGGGSIIDLTKAVSVMVLHEGSVTDYHGTGRPTIRGLKKIMIPTTGGTGSEVTPGAVLVNPKTSFKRALGGPWVCPDYAVLDARFSLTMPEAVAVSTGMDALAHAAESYVTRCANEVTRMYSRQAFALVANHLPQVVAHPVDLAARRQVLLGSCLAGFAIFNSNTGACHAMAYPMGIYHHIPHGVAVALLLPKVVEINVEKGCELYADLLPEITGANLSGDRATDAREFSRWLKAFPLLSRIDQKLTRYGVGEDQLDFLAERGLDLASALGNNPVEFTKSDALRVLKQLI